MNPGIIDKSKQAEADIAVLEVKVENIEEKIGMLKLDIKDLSNTFAQHAENEIEMIQDMQKSNELTYKSLAEKISNIEKWRWMLMGAGIVIGSLGYDTIAKLLK